MPVPLGVHVYFENTVPVGYCHNGARFSDPGGQKICMLHIGAGIIDFKSVSESFDQKDYQGILWIRV